MDEKRVIKIVIPDTGPLISLARANALDVLLAFNDNVRIVIVDFVEFEVTRYKDKHRDGMVVSDFLKKHAGRIEYEKTAIGQMFKQEALAIERFKEDENYRNTMIEMNRVPAPLPDDPGELSITSYAKSVIKNPPGTPVLILTEDNYFVHSDTGLGMPGNPTNAHFLSTRAFLETLGKLGLIKDANAIWEKIQEKRPTIARAFFDVKARKINTDWIEAVDHDRAEEFKWVPPRM